MSYCMSYPSTSTMLRLLVASPHRRAIALSTASSSAIASSSIVAKHTPRYRSNFANISARVAAGFKYPIATPRPFSASVPSADGDGDSCSDATEPSIPQAQDQTPPPRRGGSIPRRAAAGSRRAAAVRVAADPARDQSRPDDGRQVGGSAAGHPAPATRARRTAGNVTPPSGWCCPISAW